MRVKADVDILRQIPLFAGCEPAHLQLLSFSSKRVELGANRILIKKGTKGGAAYLVLEGTAEVFENANAAGSVVATVEGGALLGELAMIADLPYGLTVKTTSAFAAQRIERDLFLRVASEFPEFAMQVIRNMNGKLDQSVQALGSVKRLFEG